MGKQTKCSLKEDSFQKQFTSTNASGINKPIGRNHCRTEKVELSELEQVLNSLEGEEVNDRTHKKYLKPDKDSKDKYFCCICCVTIDRTGYDYEVRFSIWEHISGYSHRRRLHNFPVVEKHSYNIVKNVCEKIYDGDKSECNHFKAGPARGFLLCTVCSCAVPCDPRLLELHLREKYHCNNNWTTLHSKNNEVIEQLYAEIQEKTKLKRKRELFDLFSNIPEELKLNERSIKTGCIPGYLKCKLCCKGIISTPFHLERHLLDPMHKTYKVSPFELKSNNMDDPIVRKIKVNGSFSPTGMNTFLTLVSKTLKDSVLKENARFLFKQYKRDCYFCHLCDVEFNGENVSLLFQNIKQHFQEEAHNTKVKSGFKADSINTDRFSLLEILPEDILPDIKYISVPKLLSKQMFCSLCDCSLSPIELTVLIDHLQSKQHSKKKKKVICVQESIPFTLESLFQEVVKNKEGKSSSQFFKSEVSSKFQELISKDKNLMEKQFFKLENLQLICQLCESVVGKAQSDINELRHKLTEHALSKRHTKLVAAYLEGVEHEKREREEELARLMVRLLKVDRSSKGCFKLSKKPDVVKCRACRVKVPLQFDCLKAHIEQDEHRDNIDKIRSQNEPDVWSP